MNRSEPDHPIAYSLHHRIFFVGQRPAEGESSRLERPKDQVVEDAVDIRDAYHFEILRYPIDQREQQLDIVRLESSIESQAADFPGLGEIEMREHFAIDMPSE